MAIPIYTVLLYCVISHFLVRMHLDITREQDAQLQNNHVIVHFLNVILCICICETQVHTCMQGAKLMAKIKLPHWLLTSRDRLPLVATIL